MRVLSLRPPTIWSPDTLDQVTASVAELGALTMDDDDRVLKGRYLTYRFGAAAEAGHFDGLDGLVDELDETAWFLRLDPRCGMPRCCAPTSPCSPVGWPMPARLPRRVSTGGSGGSTRGDAVLRCYRAGGAPAVRGIGRDAPAAVMGRPGAAAGGYSVTRFLYEAGHATAAREDYATAVRAPWSVPRTVSGGSSMVNLGYLAARFEDVQLAPHLLTLELYDGRFFQAITTHHVTTEHYRGLLAATAGRHQEAADSLRRAVDAEDAAGAADLGRGIANQVGPPVAPRRRVVGSATHCAPRHCHLGGGRLRRECIGEAGGRASEQGVTADPWPDHRLDELRRLGDPDLDGRLDDLRAIDRDAVEELFEDFVRLQLQVKPDRWPPAVLDWWRQEPTAPVWLDEQQLTRAVAIFETWLPEVLASYLLASLPTAYAGAKGARASTRISVLSAPKPLIRRAVPRDAALHTAGEPARRAADCGTGRRAGPQDAALPCAGAHDGRRLSVRHAGARQRR